MNDKMPPRALATTSSPYLTRGCYRAEYCNICCHDPKSLIRKPTNQLNTAPLSRNPAAPSTLCPPLVLEVSINSANVSNVTSGTCKVQREAVRKLSDVDEAVGDVIGHEGEGIDLHAQYGRENQ
jgi:hypothetical protein